MEEEEKQEIFQAPSQFESRTSGAKNGSGAKKYLVILLSIIVIGLLIFGVGRFLTGGNSSTALNPTPTQEAFPTDIFTEPTEEPSPTTKGPTPTEKPSPTTTPKPSGNPVDSASGLDRSDLSIHVLNGSGVSGAAKKASDYLESLGYNVADYDNAENSDYAQTEIQIKSDSSDFLALLKKDLSSNYTIGSTSNTPPASETADAVVIIGKE